jgi:hypothetical protein
MTSPDGIRKTMRLLSAKPPTLTRPQSHLDLGRVNKRVVQSAAPGKLEANQNHRSQRPMSKYRQDYENEIDEIFEESEIVGRVALINR